MLIQSCQAHPAARHDFAELRDRDLVDIFCVLDALDARLGIESTLPKQERARKAVELFIDDQGFFPSSPQYVAWRKGSPARRWLPSESSVRRAFNGSWEALRGAFGEGLGQPDLTAARGVCHGPFFEKAELSTIFLAWVGSLPEDSNLSRHALEEWLKDQAVRPTTELPRVPQSFEPFRRADTFGGWQGLVDEHGMTERASRGGAARRMRSPQYLARLLDPVGPDHFGRRSARASRPAGEVQLTAAREFLAALPDSELWSDDHSTTNLRGVRAGTMLFGSLLSGPQYIELRELAIDEAASRGLDCDWPHLRSVRKRWGSWPAAKVAAGGMTESEAAAGSTRHRYGDPELDDYLLCALRERGLGLDEDEFSAWRPGHQRNREQMGLRPRVPVAALIADRLGGGSFDVAVERVLDRHPSVRAELEAAFLAAVPGAAAPLMVRAGV